MKRTLFAATGCTLLLLTAACTEESPAAAPSADCEPEWQFSTVEDDTLTIATVNSLPYVDVQPDGTGSGIDYDLLSSFAERACLAPTFQVLDGAAAVAAMTEGRADVAAGGWYITEERGEVIGQTQPVWFDFNAIISSDGYETIGELEGLPVGVEAGSAYEAPLVAALGEGNVTPYPSVDAIFQDLEAGRIDAAVASGSQSAYQVKQRESDLTVSVLEPDASYPELTSTGQPNYPFTKDNAELGDALESFITEVRDDGTVEEVLAEYGLTDPRNFEGA